MPDIIGLCTTLKECSLRSYYTLQAIGFGSELYLKRTDVPTGRSNYLGALSRLTELCTSCAMARSQMGQLSTTYVSRKCASTRIISKRYRSERTYGEQGYAQRSLRSSDLFRDQLGVTSLTKMLERRTVPLGTNIRRRIRTSSPVVVLENVAFVALAGALVVICTNACGPTRSEILTVRDQLFDNSREGRAAWRAAYRANTDHNVIVNKKENDGGQEVRISG